MGFRIATFVAMTLAELLYKFQRELLHLYEADEVKAMFSLVAKELLNFSNTDLILHKIQMVSAEHLVQFEEILKRLASGEPIQYILEVTQFYGLPFKVNSSVLIPRPETEELVEWVLSFLKPITVHYNAVATLNKQQRPINILDMGTGSGCIAISLKKNLSNATVNAIDISENAIAIAKENAILNNVEVKFNVADILSPRLSFQQERFDVIVSNPPYVKEDEKTEMHQNVLANEPHTALFVPNANPLLFYKAIADYALMTLVPDGLLFFEINSYLGKETVQLLEEIGFCGVTLRQDMQGKDRMVLARMPGLA